MLVLAALLIVGAVIFFSSQARAVVVEPNGENGNGLDHFKCYTAKGEPINDLVFLRDQFGKQDGKFERDLVDKPEIFCNPTRKLHGENESGINYYENHLTWYRIASIVKEKFQSRLVTVFNQFAPNGQVLKVVQPLYLAVPTQKVTVDGEYTEHDSPRNLDHFKCYQVTGKALNPPANVRLLDQFSRDWNPAQVVIPLYLCNPTDKVHFLGWDNDGPHWNISQVQNPNDHLVCYVTKVNNDSSTKHELGIDNQFGRQTLKTQQTRVLCVPSEKQEGEPQPTGD